MWLDLVEDNSNKKPEEASFNNVQTISKQLEILRTSSSKFDRKKALEFLASILKTEIKQENICDFWNEIRKEILRCLQDTSERNRELSISIIKGVYSSLLFSLETWCHNPDTFLGLSILIPLWSKFEEPSEEIRLTQLQILNSLCEFLNPKYTSLYYEEFIAVSLKGLQDNYPDIKVECCDFIKLLSNKLSTHFHLNSSSLLKPMLVNLSHQQKKVRLHCVEAISNVICSLNRLEDFQDYEIGVHLANRTFDPIPAVRIAVINCITVILSSWKYCHRFKIQLISLLLSFLADEIPEVIEVGRKRWETYSESWLQTELKTASNKNHLKERLDFEKTLAHYPIEVSRPSFASRELVSRNFYQILPAAWCDIKDWKVETRVKTSNVLKVLFLHMEQNLTEHTEEILNNLCHGIYDNDPEVVSNLLKAAFYYGHFVDPHIWISSLLDRIYTKDGNISTEILIMSHIIKGTEPAKLQNNIEKIGNLLANDDICMSYDEERLSCILELIEALLEIGENKCINIQGCLFKTLICNLALTSSLSEKNKCKDLMVRLADITGLKEVSELYERESGVIFEHYSKDCFDWSMVSPEAVVFGTLLQEAGPAVCIYSESIVSIFKTVLDSSKSDNPELQLKFFIYLSKQLQDTKTFKESKKSYLQYVTMIVKDLVVPALKWSSGKKAEAVRTAAASTLMTAFDSGLLKSNDISNFIQTELFPRMNSLLEDTSTTIRTFMIITYLTIFNISKPGVFGDDNLMAFTKNIVRRLNDVSNEIRTKSFEALIALERLFVKLNPEFEDVYKNVLLHMDDDSQNIRLSAFNALKEFSKRSSTKIESILSESSSSHRYQEEIKNLSSHIKDLNIS